MPKRLNAEQLQELLRGPIKRARCSTRGHCDAATRIAAIGGANGGGIELAHMFGLSKPWYRGQRLVLRQRGVQSPIYLDFCPFCGVELRENAKPKAARKKGV